MSPPGQSRGEGGCPELSRYVDSHAAEPAGRSVAQPCARPLGTTSAQGAVSQTLEGAANLAPESVIESLRLLLGVETR